MTRDELHQIPARDREIQQAKARLASLQARAESTEIRYEERVQSSGGAGREAYMAEAADTEREIEALAQLQAKAKLRARDLIEGISDQEYEARQVKKVLRYRYLHCWTWEAIAEATCYSYRWTQRLARKGEELLFD